MLLDIDNFIIVGFLILTFITGIGHARGITTIKDYALGGRNFSTGAIVSTLVATWISGSFFSTALSRTYSDGWYYAIAASGMSVSFLIAAFLFIPRMGEFLGNNSIAESMGSLYGSNIRVITAITGIIVSVGIIAVQFKVFGNLCSYFLGLPSKEAIILAAAIVTLYSAFGGIKAVTFTDVLQICTFGFSIPIIGVMIWNHLYYNGITFDNSLSNPKFNLYEVFNFSTPKSLQMIPLILYFAIPGLEPAFCQRILIGNNVKQVKKAFTISAGLLIIIILTTTWIPFLIFNVDSTLESDKLLNYIIEHFTYIGLKGLLVVGIVAMAMSTADSNINASAVLFANDICTPLKIGKNKELIILRIISFVLGIGGIILALSKKDLLNIVLTANSFYMPVVTVPLMLAILGFRSSTKSVLIGMSAGFITVIIWWLLKIEADCIVFAMLINLIFLMASHYLLGQPGGWIGVRDKGSAEVLQEKEKVVEKSFISKISDFSFTNYYRKNFPTNEFYYTGLGIYIALFALTTMYSTQTELLKENSKIILAFYQIMLVSGMFFFIRPIWPMSIDNKIKETIAQILWPIVIFIVLILLNTFFVIVSDFNIVQVGLFSVNLVVAALLLGWQLAIVCIISGILIALKLHQYYNPDYQFAVYLISPAFISIYILGVMGAIILLFLKPKQDQFESTEIKAKDLEYQVKDLRKLNDCARREFENISLGIDSVVNQFENKEKQYREKTRYLRDKIRLMSIEMEKLQDMKDEFLRNIPHESNAPLTGILSLSDALYASYDSLDKKAIKDAIKNIVNSGDRLKTYIYNVMDLSKLASLSYELEKEPLNLSELVKTRPYLYKKVFPDDEKQKFKFDVEDDIIINVDRYFITQALDNLISNAVKYGEGKAITISLKQVNNKIEFKIIDQGIGIPENELLKIFNKFTTSSRTKNPSGGRGIGLTLAQKIIEAHTGEIWAKNNKKQGATFYFVIPSS